MSELTFFQSKQKQLLTKKLGAGYLLFTTLMVFGGLYIGATSLVISLILVGLMGSFLFFLLLRRGPTVIVNEDGIKSRVNGMGLIRWKAIDSLEIKDGVNARCLALNSHDPEKLLADKNLVVSILMRSNIKRLGSPAVIPQSEFAAPLEEVKEKIEAFRRGLQGN